jgi:hypothetical protein
MVQLCWMLTLVFLAHRLLSVLTGIPNMLVTKTRCSAVVLG